MTLVIDVDLRSHVPIYIQIVERVGHLVATGVLLPGDQLPTVRQLATDLRVNFNTVARAYRLLDEAGVISTQQGRGTYVLEGLSTGQAEELRQAALEGLVRSFLDGAARMAFSPQAVEDEVEKQIERWRRAGTPPPDAE
ncbi:MAG: GntR family transcriptional regulator [Chloroflexi bacterium]|nr:GntR family transcriptional regulator [Chloroflexota bacterium]